MSRWCLLLAGIDATLDNPWPFKETVKGLFTHRLLCEQRASHLYDYDAVSNACPLLVDPFFPGRAFCYTWPCAIAMDMYGYVHACMHGLGF